MIKKCIWLLFLTFVNTEVKIELLGEMQNPKHIALYFRNYLEDISKVNEEELKSFGVTSEKLTAAVQNYMWFFYRETEPPKNNLNCSLLRKRVKVKTAEILQIKHLKPLDITDRFKTFYATAKDPNKFRNNITSKWVEAPTNMNQEINFLIKVKGLGNAMALKHDFGHNVQLSYLTPSSALTPEGNLSKSAAHDCVQVNVLALRVAVLMEIIYETSLTGIITSNHMVGVAVDRLLQGPEFVSKFDTTELISIEAYYKSVYNEVCNTY